MTRRSEELQADFGKLLIQSHVHRAAVTMVTRLVFPSKPQQTLAEFQSQGQKRGGLATVLLELRVTKEERMWRTAGRDAIEPHHK